MIRCVNLIAHGPISWKSFLPKRSSRSNLKGLRAGLSSEQFMSKQKCVSYVQSSLSDSYKFISFSPDRSWPTVSNSGNLGSLSFFFFLFFISEEKSSPRADTCLLLALSFLSGLANFVSLNVAFKLFLHYDNLS